MSGAKNGITAFLRDTAGNILPMAAIAMLLIAALVGGGVDMSRAYRAQNRLQSACDAAALAGRRAVTTEGFDTASDTQAKSYFETNFNQASLEASNTSKSFSSPDNGQTVVGSASTELKLSVMQIFGFQKFALSVNCQASMGVGNSDVVMVLDTTGSMTTKVSGITRLSALQTAMKNFYATVKTATTGTNARIRYGFVPYSATVNVGKLLYAANSGYLVNTRDIHSRQPVPTTTLTDADVTKNGAAQSYGGPYSSSNCTANLPANTYTNNGSATTSPTTYEYDDGDEPDDAAEDGYQAWTSVTKQPVKGRYYECYKSGSNWYIRYYENSTWNRVTTIRNQMVYKRVTYDVSAYKAFSSVSTNTGDFGAAVSSTWAGCIEERGGQNQYTSFSYSSTTGISPASALDLNVDSAPTSEDNTKWAPLWPQVAYLRLKDSGSQTNTDPSNYGQKASTSCPYDAQLLTEMTQEQFDTYAGKLKAEGSTYLDIGMVWGGRLSSPDGIFSTNVKTAPNNGGEVSRHIIFMTDGIMDPSPSSQSAWGIEYHDRRVTSDGSDTQDTSRHTSRFLAICEQIKAKGIRVWAISFTSGTNSSLSTCASANSYYNADNPTQLNAAFQEIAKQVGELRLTQ